MVKRLYLFAAVLGIALMSVGAATTYMTLAQDSSQGTTVALQQVNSLPVAQFIQQDPGMQIFLSLPDGQVQQAATAGLLLDQFLAPLPVGSYGLQLVMTDGSVLSYNFSVLEGQNLLVPPEWVNGIPYTPALPTATLYIPPSPTLIPTEAPTMIPPRTEVPTLTLAPPTETTAPTLTPVEATPEVIVTIEAQPTIEIVATIETTVEVQPTVETPIATIAPEATVEVVNTPVDPAPTLPAEATADVVSAPAEATVEVVSAPAEATAEPTIAPPAEATAIPTEVQPTQPVEVSPTLDAPTATIAVIEATATQAGETTPAAEASPSAEATAESTEAATDPHTEIAGEISGQVLYAQSDKPVEAQLTLTRIDAEMEAVGATVNADGSFVLSDLSPGDYRLEASAPGFLSALAELTLDGGSPVELPAVTLRAGDTNRDNAIDIQDVALVAANFDAPAVVLEADLNGDGWVDIRDLSLVGAQFGLIGPLPWAG